MMNFQIVHRSYSYLSLYECAQNHSGQTLPEAELATFIFPHGLSLKYSTMQRFPVPVYFTFVLTDEKGAHIYTACLKFYEKISNQEVANFFKYTDEKVM